MNSTLNNHNTESNAAGPLILAIDVGTSSARAILYDTLGNAFDGLQGRVAYQMSTTPDGGVEISADEMVAIVARTLDDFIEHAGPHAARITGVACCTFWHSLVGVSEDGRAVTPVLSWNDTRARGDAESLARDRGVDWFHARTGARSHASYYPAKLLWLRRTRPADFARAAHWMSFAEYLHLQLFGRTLCSVSMASGTGLFNPNLCDWDSEVLAAVGIERAKLSALARDGEYLAGLGPEYASRWPALAQLPWFPAIGDGAASNLGSGCFSKQRVALMVGTSGAMRVCFPAERVEFPAGLWCYRANRKYVLLGGALSNAGDVYAWCGQTLELGEHSEIETQLAALAADGHGLTVLPFFSGERSTGWHDNARAAVTGMSLNTRPIDILHAAMEAVAYRFAAIYELLANTVSTGAQIVASGGGILHSPVWTGMMADVIGVPVVASAAPEASSRGAALLAAIDLGLLSDLDQAPVPLGQVYEPHPERHEIYRRARLRQEELYRLLVGK